MAVAQPDSSEAKARTEWIHHALALVVLLVISSALVLLMDPDAVPGPDAMMVGLLIGSVLLVAASAGRRRLTLCYSLTDAINLPTWDFSSSWAANLTTVGAIFGTVLTSTLNLPAAPLLSKDAYTGLFLFFGGVVIVAGFFYTATRGAHKS